MPADNLGCEMDQQIPFFILNRTYGTDALSPS